VTPEQSSDNPGTVTKSQQAKRKGDASLFAGETFVTFGRAALYAGVVIRQIERLANAGTLTRSGHAANRRISVESLLKYLLPKEITT
jgi:hypothetical protein